jgi:1-deoxy-D-xylulose-5-phosphate reductoisomerase
MRTPIAQALAHPERIDAGVPRLELPALAALAFAAPDLERFPCLGLAYAALDAGGSAPVALNAANEVPVEAFLTGRARFTDIPATCAEVLARLPARAVGALDEALAADGEARRAARDVLGMRDDGPSLHAT